MKQCTHNGKSGFTVKGETSSSWKKAKWNYSKDSIKKRHSTGFSPINGSTYFIKEPEISQSLQLFIHRGVTDCLKLHYKMTERRSMHQQNENPSRTTCFLGANHVEIITKVAKLPMHFDDLISKSSLSLYTFFQRAKSWNFLYGIALKVGYASQTERTHKIKIGRGWREEPHEELWPPFLLL